MKKQEVIRVERKLKCCGYAWFGCLSCCAMSLKVESPPGVLTGSVEQVQSCLSPTYDVKDSKGDTVLKIKGPGCMQCPECCQIGFQVSLFYEFFDRCRFRVF